MELRNSGKKKKTCIIIGKYGDLRSILLQEIYTTILAHAFPEFLSSILNLFLFPSLRLRGSLLIPSVASPRFCSAREINHSLFSVSMSIQSTSRVCSPDQSGLPDQCMRRIPKMIMEG